jgi:hypothetical protein
VQSELLEKYPRAPLRVYAVWFNMIWTDSRWLRRDTVLRDPRVVHFWDKKRIVGRWYQETVTHRGNGVEWDAFFLYGPEASWDAEPPEVATWGRTILGTKDRLREALRPLLEERGAVTSAPDGPAP